MPGRCQDGVLDGDQGLEFAYASGQAPVAGAEEGGVLGAVGCHRGNTECAGEPVVAVSSVCGFVSLTGLVESGGDPGPGGEVPGGGEATHVCSGFSDDYFGDVSSDTIPRVGRDVAEVIIAETGADMSRFPTPGHLASWAGVAPGLNQSGERNKPAHTRHGDHWLTGALGVAAMAANRTKDTTFLGARYRRLARRIGKLKALVAIEHSILTAVWHVLSQNTDYHDLGGDYHTKRDPQRALRRITRDANRLGYTVRFDPIQAA